MRRFILLAAVVGMLAGGAGSARASVSSVDVRHVYFDAYGQVVQIQGAVVCSAGHSYGIRITVQQQSATATGGSDGTCTGSTQLWSIFTVKQEGGSFHSGGAVSSGQARTFGDGIKHFTDNSVRALPA